MNPYMHFHHTPDYRNPDVMSISRLPAHTRFGAFASHEEALAGSIYASSNILMLNGTWQFKLYERPEDAPAFYEENFDDDAYASIQVPGNWQVQGFQAPVYTNMVYPWEDEQDSGLLRPELDGAPEPDFPHIPAANPTGCYRKTFTLPAHFATKRLVLRFEGVETAYYVWLNGKCAGFAKDSKLPSEFDVTELAREGENLLCVQVMHFADSSYLEDQDYWYLSGIFRNVMLVAKPHLGIEDYKITALPDLKHLTGHVQCDVTITRKAGFAEHTVRMTLYDPHGKKVAQNAAPVNRTAPWKLQEGPTANTARITLDIDSVQLWNTETPVLYRAVMELVDKQGNVVDTEACNAGFKTVEIKDGVVLLNGKRLIVYGVNRHEHCWEHGRAVSREHMLEEIRQMKRMNINSVRTCHYPDSPDWYELCDECGILLVCECNIETHGITGALSHNPAWAANFVDRAMRMVCNYKNHVSIYSWSLGNESGTGPNHAAMYGFIKEYDSTRLCQYESGEPGKNVSDIRGNMYACIEQIMSLLCSTTDDRPIILVEYLYQICNSGGGLWKFNELIDRFPRFQGGYVWDWQDKCLVGINEKGEKYFAHGGDFGARILAHQEPDYMTNSGVVLADLTWKPVAHELKEAYCPVRIIPVPRISSWDTLSNSLVLIINHDPAHTTQAYRFVGQLVEDGVIVQETELTLPVIQPLCSHRMYLNLPYDKKQGCRYDLNIVIRRRAATFFAPADAVVGLAQIPQEPGISAPSAVQTDASAGSMDVTFDPATGHLIRMEKDGIIYLEGPMKACFDRPRTGLDTDKSTWGWNEVFSHARNLKETLLHFHKQETALETIVDIKYAYTSKWTILADFTYRIRGSKMLVDIHYDVSPVQCVLPRVGVEAVVAPGFEKLTYIGHGPNESYADRLMSAPYGRYESTVTREHFPFCPPSENGGHEGARHIALENDAGRKIVITPMQGVHFDVRHNTIADYRGALHQHELPLRAETYLHIDAAHAPIGGDMAWSTALDLHDMPKGGGHHLRFTVELV